MSNGNRLCLLCEVTPLFSSLIRSGASQGSERGTGGQKSNSSASFSTLRNWIVLSGFGSGSHRDPRVPPLLPVLSGSGPRRQDASASSGGGFRRRFRIGLVSSGLYVPGTGLPCLFCAFRLCACAVTQFFCACGASGSRLRGCARFGL